MALALKTRRRIALLILVFGMPVYVIMAVTIVDLFERPSFLLELAIYVGLGFLWILPLRPIFRGVGQEDPENDPPASD